MAGNGWYPETIDALSEWHTNFSTQAAANGTTLGLTAPQVTQIGLDSQAVTQFVNEAISATVFKEDMIFYRDQWLRGDTDDVPVTPIVPTLGLITSGMKGGIRKRTLAYANIIKASPNYNEGVGSAYQIIGSGPIPLLTPNVGVVAQPFSVIKLSIKKNGYDVLAVDMKRGAGDWTQIGVSQRATYTDSTPPLVAGQPEVREYRVQGMRDNARVGALSLPAPVVTTP